MRIRPILLISVLSLFFVVGAAGVASLHRATEGYCYGARVYLETTSAELVSRPRSIAPPGVSCLYETSSGQAKDEPTWAPFAIALAAALLLLALTFRSWPSPPRLLQAAHAAFITLSVSGIAALIGFPFVIWPVLALVGGTASLSVLRAAAQRLGGLKLLNPRVLLTMAAATAVLLFVALTALSGVTLAWLIPFGIVVGVDATLRRLGARVRRHPRPSSSAYR